MDTAPSNSLFERSRRMDVAPLSIYHQPWWLDIACDGQWGETVIRENGIIVARMPYPIRRRLGLVVSDMPSLVRTLGPAVAEIAGKPVARLRRRLELTEQLIDALPEFDTFGQLFDPRVEDAISFLYRGFHLASTYSFRLDRCLGIEEIWEGMNDKTRNGIRKAARSLRLHAIEDVDTFIAFHDTNLEGENRHGPDRLRRLLTAMLDRDAGNLLGVSDAGGRLVAASALVRDDNVAYHLISSRRADAPGGATSLLIWEALKIASDRRLDFDFDGIVSPTSLRFLSGFGGRLVQRIRVRRSSTRFKLASRVARLAHLPV